MPDPITLSVDGREITLAAGSTVAAAICLAQHGAPALTRRSVAGQVRGPLCGMGICQECRVTINGVRHRLACQTVCAAGMVVQTGEAAP